MSLLTAFLNPDAGAKRTRKEGAIVTVHRSVHCESAWRRETYT